MSNKPNPDINDNDEKRSESNIFFIIDGIIDQLNKTKKLFIIMLLTIMIIPPIAFTLSFILFGFPFMMTTNMAITGGIIE